MDGFFIEFPRRTTVAISGQTVGQLLGGNLGENRNQLGNY